MPIPKNKEELTDSIVSNYQKLKIELIEIPVSLTDRKELPGHSQNQIISVHNLLAYLVGWGELLLKWQHKKRNKIHVDFPETGFKWTELGMLAEKFYKDYQTYEFVKLLIKWEMTHLEILTLVNQSSNKELYETEWYRKWTLGRMIQLNSASPYLNVYKRIRKWKKQKVSK
jgi:hypothetical protein